MLNAIPDETKNIMETLTIHTEDKEQLETVKAVLKALKVPFEVSRESPYDPDFVAKIREGEKEFEEGRSTTIKTTEDLKSFLGIDD